MMNKEKYRRLLNRDNKPDQKDILKAVGNDAKKAWKDIQGFLKKYYDINPETVFYGSNYGWNVRYRRSGKTLCSLFPEEGAFSVLIVLGKKEIEKTTAKLDEFGDTARDIILNTEQLHDGRWLWIRIHKPEDINDIKKLLQIKRKPKKIQAF